MLYYENHPCNPSIFGKITALSYFPCLSHVRYNSHLSCTCPVGILRHCPIHSYHCPHPTAHDTITVLKWFCACALGTISTLRQEITVQTDPVVAGYYPVQAGVIFTIPFYSFVFVLFWFVFYMFSFSFFIN